MCESNVCQVKSLNILSNESSDFDIEAAYKDVKYHFMDVYNKNGYLKFSLETLRNILTADDLNVDSEIVVFETVKKWMEYKNLNPEKNLHILLDVVRLNLLPAEYLWKQVELYASPSIQLLLMAYKNKGTIRENGGSRKAFRKFLSIGSWDSDKQSIIELYDTSIDKWTHLNTLNMKKKHVAAVIANNKLMIIGGYDNGAQNTVEIIDLLTGKLTSGHSMIEKRYNMTALVIGEIPHQSVYVIGGIDTVGHRSSEKWDPIIEQWSLLPSMSQSRDCCGCAHLNGKIYAAGGRYGNTFHKSMEEYDIKNDFWQMKASMNNIRSYCRLAASQTYIYAIGGYPGEYPENPYRYVERYNPITDKWMSVASLTTSGLVGMCSYGNKILVTGGARKSTITEEYDEEKDTWKTLSPMNFGRDGPVLIEIPKKLFFCDFKW